MTVTASPKYGFPMATAGTDPAPVRVDWMAIFTALENGSLNLKSGPVSSRPASPPTVTSWLDPATGRFSVHPGAGGTWLEVPLATDAVPLFASPLASSALLTAYPLGVSIEGIGSTFAGTDGGFPYAVTAQVLTVKATTAQATQFWMRASSTYPDVWVRSMLAGGNSPWVRAAGDTYRQLSGTANQNIPDSTYTVLTWGQTDFNVGDMGFAASSLTAPTAGMYVFDACVTWQGGVTAAPNAIVSLGLGPQGGAGSDTLFRAYQSAPGTGSIVQGATWQRLMAAGDAVSLFAYHTQGATRSVTNRRLTARRA